MLSKVTKVYGETALIKLIAVGLVIGIILALFVYSENFSSTR